MGSILLARRAGMNPAIAETAINSNIGLSGYSIGGGQTLRQANIYSF